jgi:hypothetical protein
VSEPELFLNGRASLYAGDCLDVVRGLASNSIDSVCTDPPYALVSIVKRFGKDGAAPAKLGGATGVYQRASAGFMGKTWDTGETAFSVEFWAEILRVLKPGGHIAAFSGTRTYHRMACAIEDAGFEVRDQLAWCYGTGFPKSHSVSKHIDREAGAIREQKTVDARKYGSNAWKVKHGGQASHWMADAYAQGGEIEVNGDDPVTDAARQWEGWGTALKPAWECIALARKPLSEKTVAANVLRWGVGGLNIDACRIDGRERTEYGLKTSTRSQGVAYGAPSASADFDSSKGRWPANLCLSWPEDEYELRPDITKAQMRELSRWFDENP